MKHMRYITLVLLILPALSIAQLKTNVTKPNISERLETSKSNDAFVGFLDPSRFRMSHSLSMSYMSFGGGGAVVNSYINTLHYKFSEDLFLTTNIGIMNTPYSTLPGNENQNGYEFFGGAELKYFPTEKSAIYLRIEKSPGIYSGNYYNNPYGSPYGSPYRSLFDNSQPEW
jgi:hypothetical protein